MEQSRGYRRLAGIVPPSRWPEALRSGLDRGDYVHLRLVGDWVVCVSTNKNDRMPILGGGSIRIRIAINLFTGEVRRIPAGLHLLEWEGQLAEESKELGSSSTENDDDSEESVPLESPELHGWTFLGARKGIRRSHLQ